MWIHSETRTWRYKNMQSKTDLVLDFLKVLVTQNFNSAFKWCVLDIIFSVIFIKKICNNNQV